MEKSEPKNVDEYIAGFPADVQERLRKIRAVIREAAPEAEETIKHKMPAYVLKGNLVFFAAYKKFISVYPAPEGSAELNEALKAYRAEKSTLRFPLDEAIPDELIKAVVKLRVKENLKRAEAKKKPRKSEA